MRSVNLMRELSYQKSWGRNEVLKLSYSSELLHQLSSSFKKPVVSCGEAMYELLKLEAVGQGDYNVLRFVDIVYELDKNQDCDTVVSICIELNINANIINKLKDKLRARNSKRHLREKILKSYSEVY